MPECYWTVPREWPGETAFLLGGGPSLRGFDAEVLRGRGRVIAINNSFLLAPWADVLYYADRSWWRAHRAAVLASWTGGRRVSIGTSEDGTQRLRCAGVAGLSDDPSAVKHGSNGGYQAINLAYLLGAVRIVLLGYDMHVDGERTHWHEGHARQGASGQAKALAMFAGRFPALVEPLRAAGVEVINATPGSALQCWPYSPLEEILGRC
jgi:hypothetical protein